MSKHKNKHGNFFQIDRRIWVKVCELGLNEAIAYLFIAQGTDGSHRVSQWSRLSITERTGIGRGRAQAAINALIEANFIYRRPQKSKQSKPIYEVLTFKEVCDKHRNPKAKHDDKTEWIWLPKELVSGTEKGESPPLERVRQIQDVLALRLFIELYAEHDLRDECGVPRNILHEKYKSTKIGDFGSYRLFGFTTQGNKTYTGLEITKHFFSEKTAPKPKEQRERFWKCFQALVHTGLVEMVPYLFDGPDFSTSEPIHPLKRCGDEELEKAINAGSKEAIVTGYCKAASDILLEEMQSYGGDFDAAAMRCDQLAVDYKHRMNLHVFGIIRMRYRPKTKATSQWFAKHVRQCSERADFYAKIIEEYRPGRVERKANRAA